MAGKPKTVTLRYIGPVSPTDVPFAGLAGVKRGDVVEVPADIAGRGPGELAPVESPDHPVETLNERAIRQLQLVPDHHFLHRPDDMIHPAEPGERMVLVFENGEPAGNWFSYDPGEGLLAQTDNWEAVTDAGSAAPADNNRGE